MGRRILILCLMGLVITCWAALYAGAQTSDPDPSEELEEMEELDGGPGPKVVPKGPRVLAGRSHKFRLVGWEGEFAWDVVDGYPETVGEIDEKGVFTAEEGGWAIVGAYGADGTLIASSDTIWTVKGPKRIDESGGLVFSEDDVEVSVRFPPQASARALMVQIQKRAQRQLPEKAQGKGVISVFEFMALDAATGEDVGGKGFAKEVSMTLHYDDENLLPGLSEEDLMVGTFDEEKKVWELVTPNKVVSVDTENNTITIQVSHFSLWAVLDGRSAPTRLESASWGALKGRHGQ